MPSEKSTGENRCWPCTVVNSAAGLLVAWLPLAAGLVNGDMVVIAATVVWGIVATGFTVYRLITRGYLPMAASVAKRTGLHDRIGPGADRGARELDE